MDKRKRRPEYRPPRNVTQVRVNLDDVDLSWEVARDLKTNFLFANLWLHPNFHDFLLRNLIVGRRSSPSDDYDIGAGSIIANRTFIQRRSRILML